MQLDTAAVSDAMDSLNLYGRIPGIKTCVFGSKIVGPVFTIQYRPFSREEGKFYNAGNYIDKVPSGFIIFIDNQGRTDCTNWGDILTQVALQRKITGTVIYGSARDINSIRKKQYPLFTSGITMVSGKNRVQMIATNSPLVIENVQIKPKDWVFADDNGVIIIPNNEIHEILKRSEKIERTESKICEAVAQGIPLEKARSEFGYAQPWFREQGEESNL